MPTFAQGAGERQSRRPGRVRPEILLTSESPYGNRGWSWSHGLYHRRVRLRPAAYRACGSRTTSRPRRRDPAQVEAGRAR